jgi:hypothetical protein
MHVGAAVPLLVLLDGLHVCNLLKNDNAKDLLKCPFCFLVRCVQLLSSQACHLQAAGLLPGHGVLVEGCVELTALFLV